MFTLIHTKAFVSKLKLDLFLFRWSFNFDIYRCDGSLVKLNYEETIIAVHRLMSKWGNNDGFGLKKMEGLVRQGRDLKNINGQSFWCIFRTQMSNEL